MDMEMVVMRVLHILAGVIWAGSAIFLAVVLDPRLKALGPDIQRKVTAALAPSLRIVLDGGAAVTILVGILLVFRMDRLDNLFNTNWGLAITAGLVASVLALVSGLAALSTTKKLVGAGEDAAGNDDADGLSARATLLARITAALVVIAVVTMAAARFV